MCVSPLIAPTWTGTSQKSHENVFLSLFEGGFPVYIDCFDCCPQLVFNITDTDLYCNVGHIHERIFFPF